MISKGAIVFDDMPFLEDGIWVSKRRPLLVLGVNRARRIPKYVACMITSSPIRIAEGLGSEIPLPKDEINNLKKDSLIRPSVFLTTEFSPAAETVGSVSEFILNRATRLAILSYR